MEGIRNTSLPKINRHTTVDSTPMIAGMWFFVLSH